MSHTRMTTLPFLLLALSHFVMSDNDYSLILCLLCKSKTLWNIFMILSRNIEQDQMMCRIQNDNSAFLTFGVISLSYWGWSGGAKVLCILHHWGVQLILAYSWARPAILVVGKGRGGMFLFLLFLHFHSCSSFFPVPLFHLLYSLFSLFSPFLWETTQNDPQGLTCR